MVEWLFKYPRADFARGDLVVTADWPFWLLAGIGAAGLLLITVGLLRRRRQARPLVIGSIWLLQLAMLATAILMLLQPALQTEQLKPGENAIAVVVDSSSSMSYGESEPRLEAAADSLETVIAQAGALGVSARRYAFTDDAARVDGFDALQPSGNSTRIADALLEVLEDARSQSLAAVILASDGGDTAGGLDAEELAELAAYGIPVHTIGVGREAMPEDLELSQLLTPPKALPSSTISARVSIRHDGPGSAQLRVYEDDELLAFVPVELGADSTTTTAWINVDLDHAGHRRLEFSLDGGDDEPEMRNNRRSALIEVADESYRVLYFEGEPRWEYKFMRRALDDDEDIEIVSLLRVSENKFYRQGLASPEELADGFPASREALFAYDALIVGSVEAALLSDAQLEAVRDFVSLRGGTLLMLAGPNGLGSGGWGQSAIADVLPARLPPTSTDSFHRQKVPVRLTPQGSDQQMLRLAATPDENRRLWQSLPEVADYQLVGTLKPAAMTLLNVDTESGAQPLLITQPFGRGHAYILATGGTWRWQMSMPLEDKSHETFWRQLVRGLVTTTPPAVALGVAQDPAGAAVQLRAEFRDDAFSPVDNLQVRTVVSNETGESWTVDMLPSADEPGVFVASTLLTTSGSWYFEAIAERDGEPYQTARTSLYSESGDQEYFNIRRNSALLRRLSDATGGRYFDRDDTTALPELLRYSAAGITEEIRRPLWDAPAFFLLLLFLKAAEWLLRRRWSTI